VVGKYIQLPDAYKSIYEALVHGGIANDAKVNIIKIDSEELEKGKPDKYLKAVQGVLVPGGFGPRGIEGKIRAIKFAREKDIPFLGICLGMQLATVEFARDVCGLKFANSTEFEKTTKEPVISLLAEQHQVTNMGATMRLGAYQCRLEKDTKSLAAYRKEEISERHRHRFEFNNEYRDVLSGKGLVIAGIHTPRNLVEVIEVRGHRWFVGCQFHPEFQSKPDKPHPLFRDFIAAALTV